jgi:hypothetical protein
MEGLNPYAVHEVPFQLHKEPKLTAESFPYALESHAHTEERKVRAKLLDSLQADHRVRGLP